jgi:hypothetical protein
VKPFHCPSCGLPLAPGVVHGSSADCNAALEAEIAHLAATLSRRQSNAVAREPDPAPETPAVRPFLSLRR